MRPFIAALIALVLIAPQAVRAQTGTPPPSSASPTADAFGVDLASPASPSGSGVSPSVIALTGVRWVRIAADWAALEPERGRFVWPALDAQVRRASAAHDRVVLLLERTPRWAALTPNTPELVWSHQPPRRAADWEAFVRAIAGRYGSKVAAWQVEESLDLVDFRGTVREYRTMLHGARVAIGRADPRALVVAACPGGVDLPYMKTMLLRSGSDFDALMLYPRGRRPSELFEALAVVHRRILNDASHQIWLFARSDWGAPIRLATAGLAGGVTREFWPQLDPAIATVIRFLGGARFVGPLRRGPGVAALVFTRGGTPLVVAWSTAGAQAIPLPTAGAPQLVGSDGQPVAAPAGAAAGTVALGARAVFVTNPDPSVVSEAQQAAAQGPFEIPVDAAHDYSKADTVSATLGAADTEQGLYNQRLRGLPSGGVVPVVVDGVPAVRTDPDKDAVYVYFDVDDTFSYYNDGRYDFLISVEVHKASAAQRVGFNLLYDSMTGYRFSPWQWVDAGSGWVTYTFRVTDADFANTWGWDFAVNGAGDRQEALVVRSVTVKRVPAGTASGH